MSFLFKRINHGLSSSLALKLGISAALLALTTFANSNSANAASNSQAASFSYDTWKSKGTEELDLPNLRGQGLSFEEQYQNKLLGEWSLRNINGSVKMEHDHCIQ